MKKFISFLAIPMLFMACTNDDTPEVKDPTPSTTVSYKGELKVGDIISGNESDYFVMESVVSVTKNDSTVDVVLNDVKFAAEMRYFIDVTLKDIPFLAAENNLVFKAENVIPFINTDTVPNAEYKFATLHGTITGNELLFNAKMADELAFYVAGKEFEFSGTEVAE